MSSSNFAYANMIAENVPPALQKIYREGPEGFKAFLYVLAMYRLQDTEAFLFDFDDTSYNTRDAVKNSYRKAFAAKGLAIPTDKELDTFIGPPLATNIQRWVRHHPPSSKVLEPYGVSPLQIPEQDLTKCEGWCDYIDDVVKAFRKEQDPPDGDIMRCRAFDGMTDVWAEMRKAGKIIVIATSRPEESARGIIQATGTSHYFTGIYGAEGQAGKEKHVVIGRVINLLGLDPKKTVMIDDHILGVIGAMMNGIPCIGVCWGSKAYRGVPHQENSLKALSFAGAIATVCYPNQIIDLMRGHKRMPVRDFMRYMSVIDKLAA